MLEIDIFSIATKNNIHPDDFSQSWRYSAILYKELVWVITNHFSQNSAELTHSEFVSTKGKLGTIALTLDPGELTFAGLKNIFDQNPSFLHRKLRENFDLFLGWDELELGLKISTKTVDLITFSEFEKIETNEFVGQIRNFDSLIGLYRDIKHYISI